MNENTYQQPIPYADPPKPEPIVFSKLEKVFAVLMLLFGFCFIKFVLFNIQGYFTTVFFATLITSFIIFAKKKNFRFSVNHYIQAVILYIFSITFSVTANELIKSLNTVFLIFAGAYWIYSICGSKKNVGRYFFFEIMQATLSYPFANFGKAGKAISDTAGKTAAGKNIKLAILGLAITFPLTALVGSLLMSADDGMQRMINKLSDNFLNDFLTVAFQFVLGIPVAFYIFGMLYSNTVKSNVIPLDEDSCASKIYALRFSPNMVMYASVTPVCILYLMFFISQINYYLSAFYGKLPDGFSYAEYARKGFFELFALSIINLGIITIISFISKNTGKDKPPALKAYIIALSLFTILIIATALRKMILYIENYGLTQLRIYTSWFMLLLSVLFIFIIIKQFRFSFNFARYSVVAFVLLFGILSFSRVDWLIAYYNINMYQAGELNELDTKTLMSLSDDSWLCILDNINIQDFYEANQKSYPESDLSAIINQKQKSYEDDIYSMYNISSYRVMLKLDDK